MQSIEIICLGQKGKCLTLVWYSPTCNTQALGRWSQVLHMVSNITPEYHICLKPLPKDCWYFLTLFTQNTPLLMLMHCDADSTMLTGWLTPSLGAQWVCKSFLAFFSTKGRILFWRINDEPQGLKPLIIKLSLISPSRWGLEEKNKKFREEK